MKLVVVSSTLFLLTLSFSLLFFGDNVLTHESELIEEASNAARVDLLFTQPHEGH